jgi:hypothetical protein
VAIIVIMCLKNQYPFYTSPPDVLNVNLQLGTSLDENNHEKRRPTDLSSSSMSMDFQSSNNVE